VASDFESKIDPNNGGNGKSLDIVVSYADKTDKVTILLVKDGEDGEDGESAFSIVLSNPNMTFNTNNPSAEESTEVFIYSGAT
jgi:hypothetical protein